MASSNMFKKASCSFCCELHIRFFLEARQYLSMFVSQLNEDGEGESTLPHATRSSGGDSVAGVTRRLPSGNTAECALATGMLLLMVVCL